MLPNGHCIYVLMDSWEEHVAIQMKKVNQQVYKIEGLMRNLNTQEFKRNLRILFRRYNVRCSSKFR